MNTLQIIQRIGMWVPTFWVIKYSYDFVGHEVNGKLYDRVTMIFNFTKHILR